MLILMSMFWGALPLVLGSTTADAPQGTSRPIHNFAEFGAYAESSNFDYQVDDPREEDDNTRYQNQHMDYPTDETHIDYQAGMLAFQTQGTEEEGPEGDTVGLMQQTEDDPAWYALLEAVQSKLQSMAKVERALVVDYMIKRLDWQCTDTANGYLLGHMGGRVSSITALLVAYRDDTELDSERATPPEAEGMWAEAAHFLPTHPGSRRQRGCPVGTEEPIIMLFHREVPSEFLTPGYTPPNTPRRASSRRKRQCITMEISSGSNDEPRTVRTLHIPHNAATTTVQMSLTVQDVDDSESTTTVAADPQETPTGAVLTPPAPGTLASLGVSLLDLWKVQQAWKEGTIAEADLVRTYGSERGCSFNDTAVPGRECR